jgi:hypothetical protein
METKGSKYVQVFKIEDNKKIITIVSSLVEGSLPMIFGTWWQKKRWWIQKGIFQLIFFFCHTLTKKTEKSLDLDIVFL